MANVPAPTRVLIVEDDVQMLSLLARCLKRWGYIVESEVDGAAAWRRLEGGLEIDVLLTDKHLPGMNGLQLLGAARRRFPALLTLMITADATVQSAREAIAAGALGFLVKPFDDLTDLRRELEGSVSRARQGARAATLTAVSAALRRAGARRGQTVRAAVAGTPSFDRDFLAQLLRDDGLSVTTADDAAAVVRDCTNTALIVIVAPFPGLETLATELAAQSPETWVVITGDPPAARGSVGANVIWIAA